MALPLYLAMTAAEVRENANLPSRLAYMACHFSPYGTGLSNRPKQLPEGTMLILNDRTPIHGHDPSLITDQLTETIEALHCSSLLLDFQRPGCEETAILAEKLIAALPCPVGLSAAYCKDGFSPVFLPPPPLDTPLQAYLAPWQGREVWLETALDGLQLTLTSEGCRSAFLPHPFSSEGFPEKKLHCHYHIQAAPDRADFSLWRTREDLDALLAEAEGMGVVQAIGLWQEFTGLPHRNDTERYPIV